jgi:hypothetical protein
MIVSEALNAANEAFKGQKTDDRFELANGDGSTIIFPEDETDSRSLSGANVVSYGKGAMDSAVAEDRVGSRRLRAVTLPHHRTSGFPHPAVEPGSGFSPLRPAMV